MDRNGNVYALVNAPFQRTSSGEDDTAAEVIVYNKDGDFLFNSTYAFDGVGVISFSVVPFCGGDFYLRSYLFDGKEYSVKFQACDGNTNVKRFQCK